MPPECRKCTYFQKKKNEEKFYRGKIILGFCRLRGKHVSDETIGKEFCKDRAVIP